MGKVEDIISLILFRLMLNSCLLCVIPSIEDIPNAILQRAERGYSSYENLSSWLCSVTHSVTINDNN